MTSKLVGTIKLALPWAVPALLGALAGAAVVASASLSSEAAEKLLIAVAAAFLGFVLGWAREILRERERRHAIAGAVLYDLQDLENALHDLMADAEPATGLFPTNYELSDVFVRELTLFKPATVQAVLAPYGYVRALTAIQADVSAGRFPDVSLAHWGVQLNARRAAAAVGLAKPALESEGGWYSATHLEIDMTYPNLPEMPSRSFAARKLPAKHPTLPIKRV